MTVVECRAKDDEYSVCCCGHATGSERVCAGVSAIVYALEGWCINSGDITAHKSDIMPGEARISFTGKEPARAAFEMAYIGLKQIEKANGAYIKVILL